MQGRLMAIHVLYLPAPSRAWDLAAIEADAAGQLADLLDTCGTVPRRRGQLAVVQGHTGPTLVGPSAQADLMLIGRHAEHPVLALSFHPGLGVIRRA
jgi:hypothetical protein